MATPVVLSIPARDRRLRDEIGGALAPHASVRAIPPQTLGLEEIRVAIEIAGGVTGIAANVAGVLGFLLLLKDRARQEGRPSGVVVEHPRHGRLPLDDADEALLRELLEGSAE